MPHLRQKNVQQQNANDAKSIQREAVYWRQRGAPVALQRVGESRGIDWSRAIILRLELDFPGMPALWGELLTQDGRFVAFEIDSDSTHKEVLAVDRWEDVTAEENLGVHNRGIGKGHGAIALETQHELAARDRTA